MHIFAVLAMVVGLSMDAFAVSVGLGLANPFLARTCLIRFSSSIGLFHFFMPILGWCAGAFFDTVIAPFDHWAAFGLLSLVGLKMVYESLNRGEGPKGGDPTRGLSLVVLCTATSVDAFAVGMTMGVLNLPLLGPAIAIAAVAAGMTFMGLTLGRIVGFLGGKLAEVAGGLILVGIGLKVLLEHL